MYLAVLLLLLAKIPYTKPQIPAGIYAGSKLLILIAFDAGLILALFGATIGFFAALGYFILLRRFDNSVFAWFVVAVVGALLVAML